MPKTIKEERLRWILPIYNKQIKLINATKVCSHSQRSLERWLKAYREKGEAGLEPKSTKPQLDAIVTTATSSMSSMSTQ